MHRTIAFLTLAVALCGCSDDDSASSASGPEPADAGVDGDAGTPDDTGAADAIPDATAATVESLTSVTYKGVTFTFDRPVPVGRFVTGEPFALSSESFSITAIDPASSDLEGDGHVGHGAMLDPFVESEQGFDSYIGNSETGAMRHGNTPYVESLNVDPAISGPIEIAVDQETTIVKSVRLDSVTDPEQWQTIDKYVPLTTLSVAPPEDAYPPSSSALQKKLYRRAFVDGSVLRELAMPASFDLDVETAQSRVPSDLGQYGSSGEKLRRFRLDRELGMTDNNYSGHIAVPYAQLMILLNSGLSSTDRQAIADTVIRFGIQVEGLVGRGWGDLAAVGEGAGQQGAVHPWIYYAAFLLRDAEMLSAAQSMQTSMNGNCFWAGANDVGAPAPSRNGVNAQTFFEEMEGMPFLVPDEYGSNLDTRYGVIAARISAWETVAIMMLQNGPEGVNGAEALLLDGPFEPSNPAASHLAFIDRYRTWTPYVMSAYDPGASWRDLYDLVKPLTGVSSWSGVPDQVPANDRFSGGDGEVSWDFAGYDYATETVTRRDVRYSLDGIQWIEQEDVELAGSVSGLAKGVPHFCGFRQASDAGAGAWSLNYPRSEPITSGTFRNVVTTTGSDSPAAPNNTVAPAIQRKLYPAWGAHEGNWGPVGAALGVDEVQLAAGVGYWMGYPAATFAYQWMRDGVAISGATSQVYARTAADANADLSCEVTAINASGSAVASTSSATAPPLTILSASKLVDTTFTGTFAVDYENEIAGITTSGCSAEHSPADVQKDTTTGAFSNMGSLAISKSGSHPSITFPCQNVAVAGTTYTVTFEAVLGFVNSGGAKLDVLNTDGDSVLDGGALELGTNDAGHTIVSGTTTFTMPAGVSGDLSVQLAVATATGGTAGGDARLTRLTIEE